VLCAGCLCSIWHNNNISDNNEYNIIIISRVIIIIIIMTIIKVSAMLVFNAWWVRSSYGKYVSMIISL